jgi:hypothetical protein
MYDIYPAEGRRNGYEAFATILRNIRCKALLNLEVLLWIGAAMNLIVIQTCHF